MTTLFTIFNHKLTEIQRHDAYESIGVESIIDLPGNLKKKWAQIPPDGSLDMDILQPIITWLKTDGNPGDFVLVQGEFGAAFYLVDFCFKSSFIPVYATTRRESVEKEREDGSIEKKMIFRHIQFREYKRYEEEER